MIKKNTRWICLALALSLLLSLAACKPDTPEVTEPTSDTYTVQILAPSGAGIENVDVYVYNGDELVWYAKTDAEGKMSFQSEGYEGCVAVLSGVPTGYKVEENYPLTGLLTQINLTAGQMEDDPQDLTYKLGDMVMDFSVTDADGKTYKLSELLQQKKAVILNFWYENCAPCKMEFPYLQEAYTAYSDKIEVLAMNTVDSAEKVAAFKSQNGYTFPMIAVDRQWQDIMALTAYPTTVVIDRFGNIVLIHSASIDGAETFQNVFEYFSADDYVQKFLTDITETEPEKEAGSEDNPLEFGGVTEFDVTVEAGKTVYVNVYRINEMLMQIKSGDVSVIYKGKNYKPSGGVVELMVNCEDTYTPANLAITNNGSKDQTFHATFSSLSGSYDNPIALSIGEFTATVPAGNAQGVYYTYVAAEDGVLTLQCLSAADGAKYGYFLYNLDSGAMRSLDSDSETLEGGTTGVSIPAKKGQTVQVCISSLPDENNEYPGGSFGFKASFVAGQVDVGPQTEKIAYSITVKDESGKPLSNVNVSISVGGSATHFATNAEGVAAILLEKGTYTVTLTLPDGYTVSTTTYTLTEAAPTVTVTLTAEKVTVVDYTVTVKDDSGNAVPNVLISIGGTFCTTNASGVASAQLKQGSYSVTVTVPEGYTSDKTTFDFASGASALTVTLTKKADEGGSGTVTGTTYSVTVKNADGSKVSNVLVVIQKGSEQKAYGMTDANGVFTAVLPADDYTVSLTTDRYYDDTDLTLSATKTSITVTLAAAVDSKNTMPLYIINDNDAYLLYVGTTHVELGTGKAYYSAENGNNCFFVFVPTEAGTYKITLDVPGVNLSLWGVTTFINHQQDSSDSPDNSLTLDVKSGQVGNVEYVLGIEAVSGVTDAAISIIRMGDAGFDIEAQPWDTAWQSGYKPEKFTMDSADGQKLTYVDVISGTAAEYKAVYNPADGYYHLGTADGPVLYVNLGTSAPYVSIKAVVAGTGSAGGAPMRKYFYNASGNFIKKEDYTALITEYCNCIDSTYGVYPVTADLAYMIQNGSEAWWSSSSPNPIIVGANQDIAWMFAVCYIPQ